MHPDQHNFVVTVLPTTSITVDINDPYTCIKYSSYTLTSWYRYYLTNMTLDHAY